MMMVRTASTPATRTALVHMAETWQRLADEQEKSEATPPVPSFEDRPVVQQQQQQQVQPKDGDEKD